METMDQAWFDADQPVAVDAVTMTQFEQLCQALLQQRELVEDAAGVLKALNERKETLTQKVLAYLREMKRDNFRVTDGSLLSVVEKRSWALPKGDEERTAFFSHLKAQGLFDGMITVNSNTFNAWLKGEFAKAEAEGRAAEFRVPGVGEPSVYATISVKGATSG